MRVFIATDFRTIRNNNRLYLDSQYYFIVERYKEGFGEVVLCSRVVEGENVEGLYEITDIVSEFIGARSLTEPISSRFQRKMRGKIEKCNMVVGRYHSIIASVATKLAHKAKKPLYAEVMGDAWDSYWNHSKKGKIVAPFMLFITKKCVRNADYALYVTHGFLQKRYPTKGKQIGVSDVKISEINLSILDKRLSYYKHKDFKFISLMTTAAVDVLFKGQQYVIEAIPLINKAGIKVNYVLVGGGDNTFLRELAEKLNVLEQVEFRGKLTLNNVFETIDSVDVYIQPSLQEGLPRSVVEAMSRACPCLGACTGGIPELLTESQIFPRKSASAIAKKIIEIANYDTMEKLSTYSFEIAKDFLDIKLSEKRKKFYNMVKRELK